jgi:hypothetical protein
MRFRKRGNRFPAKDRCGLQSSRRRQIANVINDSRNPRAHAESTDSVTGIGTEWANTLYRPVKGENLHSMDRLL